MKSVGGIVIGSVIALAGVGVIVASCNKKGEDYLLGYDCDDDLEIENESEENENTSISENAKEALASL